MGRGGEGLVVRVPMLDLRDIAEVLGVYLRNPIFQRASVGVRFLIFINHPLVYLIRKSPTKFWGEIFVWRNVLSVSCELLWAALLPHIKRGKGQRLRKVNLMNIEVFAPFTLNDLREVNHIKAIRKVSFLSFLFLSNRIHSSLNDIAPIYVIY